jgi:acid phosphatase
VTRWLIVRIHFSYFGLVFHRRCIPPANLSALASQGIELTNYFALTHPSEPNYVASVGGEYFGMDNDNLNNIPANVSTIVDLLEDKGITWAEYEEDMPSTGFTGLQFLNGTGANDYVRKHKCVSSLCLSY